MFIPMFSQTMWENLTAQLYISSNHAGWNQVTQLFNSNSILRNGELFHRMEVIYYDLR